MVIGGEGKCRKHLGKDIIWSVEKRKFRKEKIFGEGKYLVSGGGGERRKHLVFILIRTQHSSEKVTEGEMLSRRRKD